jgi:hypothetical protein
MYHTEDILAGARTIRRYLKDPLQLTYADDLDRQLEALLQRTDDLDRAADDVMDLLAQNETTTEWMRRFLESSNQEQERSFQGSIGTSRPPRPDVYTCPNGGCRWVIRTVGDEPKSCQKNGEPMGTTQEPWCPSFDVALRN